MSTKFPSPCCCSGNAKLEPGAICSRVSASFIRFGSFQLPASRGGVEVDMVKVLADYVIRHHYPHLQGEPAVDIWAAAWLCAQGHSILRRHQHAGQR